MNNYKVCKCILLICVLFFVSCGESVYSGAENSNSKEAKIDALDFSFIKNNCNYISYYYDDHVKNGTPLDDESLYKYVSAILACSGFDIISGLDSILSTGGEDIYETVGAIIGHKVIDINTSANLQTQYVKAVDICRDYKMYLQKDNKTLNNTNLTLCGLAGIMGTVINVSDMLLNSSGGGADEFELSEYGLEDFGQEINPTMIVPSLLSYLKGKNSFSEDLDNSLTFAEDATVLVGDLFGQDDFTSIIDDLAGSMRDSDGNITQDSLLAYISNVLNVDIPEDGIFNSGGQN